MMFLLNMKALVEPIPSPYTTLTFGKVRTLTAVMSSPLMASTWSPFLLAFSIVAHTGCTRYRSLHCFCHSPRRLSSRPFSGALLASLFYTPVLCQHSSLHIYSPRRRVLDHRAYVACPRHRTCLWRSVSYLCTRWERGFSSAYLPFRCVLDHMCNVCTS